MKICTQCKIEKDEKEFHKCSRVKNGLMSKCKSCRKIVCKKSYDKIIPTSPTNISFKKCSKCDIIKPINQFFKRWQSPDGYRSDCKTCNQNRNKTWKEHHKIEVLKMNRKYKENLDVKIKNWQQGAKTRDIEWNISAEDIKSLPMICFYTGLKLTYKTNEPNSVSLERIDSNKGYVKSNVTFCCKIVNIMKRELPLKIFLTYCKLISENKKLDKYFKVKYNILS